MQSAVGTGAVLAGFRVESLIGHGAMGAVYLAVDTKAGGRVALKLLTPELSADERYRQRFMREAELVASLKHRHVVPILSFGEEDGCLYLAMAYVEGVDLRELLRREGRLEPARMLDLIAQVAEALDAAHAAELVHRDVKPANILVARVEEAEHAYVCDFGLARHVSSVSSLTGDRGFVGTLDYVSPEQIAGGRVDRRADVYSLGCVLYECLTGERPFERESDLALVYAHLNDAPPHVTDLRRELPEALDNVIATALAKEPDERYATCGKLIEAARSALSGETVHQGRRGRRLFVATTIAVVALAVTSSAGIHAIRGGAPAPPVPAISQDAIAGAKLGLTAAAYKRRFGHWRAQTLTEPDFPSLEFHSPKVAVYFPSSGSQAMIITTWNRDYRTAQGVGPCSTVSELKRAYGTDVRPSKFATQKGKVFAYTVGENLLFAVRPETKVVAAVALYDGGTRGARAPGGAEPVANYVAQVEVACTT